MIPLSLEAVASAVGGRLCDVADSSALMTAPAVVDSREVEPGGLFAALPGEHTDGHAFAANAVKAGAVAVLATHPVGVPAVVVEDVLDALAALARTVLAAVPDVTVIGLTGSAGKTSTKDLIAQVLPERGETVATVKSFNGEIGMPLTVTHLDNGVRHLVLEMGARGIGHITHLTRIAPPTVGLVLNVGTAHVGEFGGREQIAKAKGELVEALPADGLAVLNADDPLVAAMASRTRARVLTFGTGNGADVRAVNVALDTSGRASFTLTAADAHARVDLALHGAHHVSNALAAAAVAIGLGVGVEKTAAALSRAVLVASGRMEVTDRGDGVRIVNDAFNANPDSMKAAFAAIEAMADGHRTVAVLGEMKELGADSSDEHRQVGRLAAAYIDVLIAVGDEDARTMASAAQEGNPHMHVVNAGDRDHALALARGLIQPGDVVLVKGSHSVGLEHTAVCLAQPDTLAGDR
ncbi:UDP-N-acetylmuramoyl-tripeptide--D-alanyl-D-alanine ligase [Streptomyces sp. NPDC033538]|uniref:UDP-N-acetylmuramoyl-tripeptide--D-alanyl-D- alanine ligase n=1 Tax=Streptomyces sp. NPDC033538 TaxID=3155367 RepID=UPI0033F17843